MRQWIDRYAQALGVGPLADEATDTLLELASTAAHASERAAAPLSCWLAALAGLPPDEALQRAKALAETFDSP